MFAKIAKVGLLSMLEIIHSGHELGRAFNSQNGLPVTVAYCITCTGHFHGCYCEIDGCMNCEVLDEVEV